MLHGPPLVSEWWEQQLLQAWGSGLTGLEGQLVQGAQSPSSPQCKGHGGADDSAAERLTAHTSRPQAHRLLPAGVPRGLPLLGQNADPRAV